MTGVLDDLDVDPLKSNRLESECLKNRFENILTTFFLIKNTIRYINFNQF